MSNSRSIRRSIQAASHEGLPTAERKGTQFKNRRYVDTIFNGWRPLVIFYRVTKGFLTQRTPTRRAGVLP